MPVSDREKEQREREKDRLQFIRDMAKANREQVDHAFKSRRAFLEKVAGNPNENPRSRQGAMQDLNRLTGQYDIQMRKANAQESIAYRKEMRRRGAINESAEANLPRLEAENRRKGVANPAARALQTMRKRLGPDADLLRDYEGQGSFLNREQQQIAGRPRGRLIKPYRVGRDAEGNLVDERNPKYAGIKGRLDARKEQKARIAREHYAPQRRAKQLREGRARGNEVPNYAPDRYQGATEDKFPPWETPPQTDLDAAATQEQDRDVTTAKDILAKRGYDVRAPQTREANYPDYFGDTWKVSELLRGSGWPTRQEQRDEYTRTTNPAHNDGLIDLLERFDPNHPLARDRREQEAQATFGFPGGGF